MVFLVLNEKEVKDLQMNDSDEAEIMKNKTLSERTLKRVQQALVVNNLMNHSSEIQHDMITDIVRKLASGHGFKKIYDRNK